MAAPFNILTINTWGLWFLCIFTNTCYFCFPFGNSHPSRCEVVSHCDFDLHFPWLMKRPDAGKGWGQEEKRATEDKMVGWHHWLNGHEFEQAPGDRIVKDGKAWCAAVHEVAKSWKQLSTWEQAHKHERSLKAPGRILPSSSSSGCFLVCGCIPPISASVFPWPFLCVSNLLSCPLLSTCLLDLGPSLIQDDLSWSLS